MPYINKQRRPCVLAVTVNPAVWAPIANMSNFYLYLIFQRLIHAAPPWSCIFLRHKGFFLMGLQSPVTRPCAALWHSDVRQPQAPRFRWLHVCLPWNSLSLSLTHTLTQRESNFTELSGSTVMVHAWTRQATKVLTQPAPVGRLYGNKTPFLTYFIFPLHILLLSPKLQT